MLYEDLLIESLKMYGQDVLYIPRETITPDEILNEEYSKYERAYMIEMYIANTDGFGGEGNLYSKFGLEIRDQATFIVSRRQFSRLVNINENAIRAERPREGDLIYLPLSKGLFEVKFVEHESPFYQLSQLPTYELQCELFEYSAEKFDTGIDSVDYFENRYGPQTVFEITGGDKGFSIGDKIKQVLVDATTDSEAIEVYGEISDFIQTSISSAATRIADLTVTDIRCSDGSLKTFQTNKNIIRIDSDLGDDWTISNVYNINDDNKYIPQEPLSQNTYFENTADDIIDFSASNPFGDPSSSD
jgi:hypothetical protein